MYCWKLWEPIIIKTHGEPSAPPCKVPYTPTTNETLGSHHYNLNKWIKYTYVDNRI